MRKKHGFLIENKTLMKEWDWRNNSKESLDPKVLKCGSSKKANWICSKCGNHWKTRISHRAIDGSICPECSKRLLSKAPFEKSLTYLYPDISKEWSKKNLVTPDTVYPQSNLAFWWTCPKGHDYEMPASKRTTRNDGCPICSNKIVISGINDLKTTYPNLMKEWDWEMNGNIGLDPTKISYGSKKRAHWKCLAKGHKWTAVVYSRTTGHSGCSKCNKDLRTSYPEKIFAFYMSSLFNDVEENYKSPELGKLEIDVYVPQLKLGIEYDGCRWHKTIKNDLKKDLLCEELGITLIRVREKGCFEYDSNAIKITVKERNNNDIEQAMNSIVNLINRKFSVELRCDVNLERDSSAILSKALTKEKEYSIGNSQLIDEWDWEKNKGIDPFCVSLHSNKKYWWRCKDYNHSWETTAAKRAIGHGCIFCSGQKVLRGFNDLESRYPDIAKEWDCSANKRKPDEVTAQSPKKKYWWICSKCGHNWNTSIYVRTVFRCGCPKCKLKITANKQSKPVIDFDTNTTYESAQQASRETGISQGSISSCCNGKTKTAGGHHWAFVKKE